MAKYPFLRFQIPLLAILLCVCKSSHGQVITVDLISELKQAEEKLKSLKAASFLATFEGTGSRKGKVLEIEAKVMLKHTESGFPKATVHATVQKPMFDQASDERIIFDGNKVYTFDFPKAVFIDRGKIDGGGKPYLGFSSLVWIKTFTDSNPFSYAPGDQLQYESTSLVNGRLCYSILIKRSSNNSRIFIDTKDKLITRIEMLTPASEPEGASVINYYGIRTGSPISDAHFSVNTTSEKIEVAQPLSPAQENHTPKQNNLLAVGSKAPAWKLKLINGTDAELKDYLGKVVILDFWATWCAPCKFYDKRLIDIYESYPSKKVMVLAMSYMESKTTKEVEEYLKRKGINYPVVMNAEKIAETYKVAAIPTLYVIGKKGEILYNITGYSEADEAKMYKVINDYLEKN